MSLLQVTQFTEKWYFCLHFFASKCRQLLVTFAEYFVLQNGFNSSQSSQLKWKRRKSMNEMNVWQNFTFPWGKPTAAIINKKTSLLSIRAALDRHLKALFFILFSRIIINVIILKQLVASGERGYRNILDPAFMTFAGPPAVTFTHMMKKRSLSAPATFPLYVCKNSKFKTPQKVGSTKMHVKNSD